MTKLKVSKINAPDLDGKCNYLPIDFFRVAYYAGVPVLKPTEACSSFGGMCVHEEDCSESTSPKGMCAERGANLECCYIGMDEILQVHFLRIGVKSNSVEFFFLSSEITAGALSTVRRHML